MNRKEYRQHSSRMSAESHTVYVERRLADREATRNIAAHRGLKTSSRGIAGAW